MPEFPIEVNGNKLDESIEPAANASETDYILVQSQGRLTPSQKQELVNLTVDIHEYVSKNTYLCSYEKDDLDKIRQIEFVVYVDIYRLDLKISPSLKKAPPNLAQQVDVIFHKTKDPKESEFKVTAKSHLTAGLRFCPHKVRLTPQGKYLNDLASIDAVRCIEDVGEISLRNDHARSIIKVDVQPKPGATPRNYQGQGQIIAIADTGLDSKHPAFTGKLQKHAWCNGARPYLNDLDGHGTHVCGSAVGNPSSSTKPCIMGTAPQADIVMQCIQTNVKQESGKTVPVLTLPTNLKDLFEHSYIHYGVRVHSNSWGQTYKTHQLPYNREANEIDDFVWTKLDMVICFAAGNDADKAVGQAHWSRSGGQELYYSGS